MKEGFVIYPAGSYIINKSKPEKHHKNDHILLTGSKDENSYQSLILFNIPETAEEADPKASLLLQLLELDRKKLDISVYALWNRSCQNNITRNKYFHNFIDHVDFEINKNETGQCISIGISELLKKCKQKNSSFSGLLLCSRSSGLAVFGGANYKDPMKRACMVLYCGKPCDMGKVVRTTREKIIPTETGALTAAVNSGFNGETSFYVRNLSNIESITAQIQTSEDSRTFFTEGEAVMIMPRQRVVIPSSVLAKSVRLCVKGSLVIEPAEVTTVYLSNR